MGAGQRRKQKRRDTLLPDERFSPRLQAELTHLVEQWADPDGRQTEEAGTVAAVMNFLQVGVEALVADVSGQRREEIAAGERERATIEAVNGFFYGKDCGGGPPGCSRRFNRRVPKPPPPS